MIIKTLIAVSSTTLLAALSAQAQASFQNLNFEQADPIVVPGTPYVTEASALPEWTVTIGGVQETEITENAPSLGAPWVSLVGPGDESNTPIDGNYSVLLQGSAPAEAASIDQIGLIPFNARSLQFKAFGGGGILDLQVGTATVPFTALETEPTYTLYGANISAWADETEHLTFSALGDSSQPNNWELDDISFSTNVVASPEPNMVALSAIGGLLFGARKWFARR